MRAADWVVELAAVTALLAVGVMQLVYWRVRARRAAQRPAQPRWQPIDRSRHRPRDPARLLDLTRLEETTDAAVGTWVSYDEPADGVGGAPARRNRGRIRK